MSTNAAAEKHPEVLTTGQVARICNVAPRTVSKWFDTGQLRGYRIPGSRDRRIPLDQLVRFMKAHSIPLNGLDAGPRRVLIVDPDGEVARTVSQQLNEGEFQIETAADAFEAGMLAERTHPHVVVLNSFGDLEQLAPIAAAVRREPRFNAVRIVIIHEPDDEPDPVTVRRGVDGQLTRPFTVRQLVELLSELGR